jgi:hypothetical protein
MAMALCQDRRHDRGLCPVTAGLPMLPLCLTDDQLDTVMAGATPLYPQDRHKYLQRIAELLYQQELGDGAVARACREAQRAFLAPPSDTGHGGRPRKYA